MIRKFPDLRRLDHLCEEYFEPLFGILDCCFRIALFGNVRFYFNCQGCCGSFDFVALGVRLTRHGEDQTSSSTTTKQEEEGSKSYQCYCSYCIQLNCDRDGVFPVCYLQTLVSEVCWNLQLWIYGCYGSKMGIGATNIVYLFLRFAWREQFRYLYCTFENITGIVSEKISQVLLQEKLSSFSKTFGTGHGSQALSPLAFLVNQIL